MGPEEAGGQYMSAGPFTWIRGDEEGSVVQRLDGLLEATQRLHQLQLHGHHQVLSLSGDIRTNSTVGRLFHTSEHKTGLMRPSAAYKGPKLTQHVTIRQHSKHFNTSRIN